MFLNFFATGVATQIRGINIPVGGIAVGFTLNDRVYALYKHAGLITVPGTVRTSQPFRLTHNDVFSRLDQYHFWIKISVFSGNNFPTSVGMRITDINSGNIVWQLNSTTPNTVPIRCSGRLSGDFEYQGALAKQQPPPAVSATVIDDILVDTLLYTGHPRPLPQMPYIRGNRGNV
jgi:hypothetical protein